ncbi:hypothetical protein K9U39_13070 [Rhodoblastus acidophilus]|uniref:CheA signal transduction histidine kinase n=1 Tax=Candidatus Rhodoblastus alkanivorans TaxID=2954117 RepID=A0ABS9ZC28_9HYPH|nr:hypothetical protein [Candidatus Rhodoblastus alkanivorans]MCI4677188.1 hypothetical protein [Candidatus Rhodoblastus alkanivorans]MCI4684541.1 hypothetical protein [Candidatus Rhodoblastus alkanivorans]MDI4641862.1 hypothetical protein [Rhodoblastus acidophilus]
MADYYPLLAKAVSGLKTSTSESRAAIYERARKALLGQLRNMQPPAPENAIEREARALDEAIARLELEFAGAQALEEKPAAPGPTPPEPAADPSPAREEQPDAAPAEPAEAQVDIPEMVDVPKTADVPQTEAPQTDETQADEARDAAVARENLRPAAPTPKQSSRGGLRRFAILAGALAAVVALVAVAAWKLRDRPEDLAKRTPAPQATEQKVGGKIEQRVGAAAPSPQPTPTPSSAPAKPAPQPPEQNVPIAYRAAVLIQAPSEPGGVKTYVGTVVWRRDSVNRGPNQQLSSAIRAEIDVPDAGLKASMTIEKNYEPTLSASHTLTIRFEPAKDSAVGDVRAINVPEMRRDDAPRGAPLQGMQVDVAPNVFLVGLYSSAEAQNVDMIRNLNWFDIPMSLANDKIAKVTFEKGAVGSQIINDVFKDWQNPPAAQSQQ